MVDQVGNLLVVWTARLAVVAWAVRWLYDLRHGLLYRPGRFRQSPPRWLCAVWTVGGLISLLHLLVAFHFVHDWDTTAAWEHVALQTAAVTGWHWGGGLYVNYAFNLLWLGDIAVCWHAFVTHRPLRSAYVAALHGLFVFMIFNATVVFGPPVWTVLFPGFAILSLVVWWFSRRTSRTPDPEPEPNASALPR